MNAICSGPGCNNHLIYLGRGRHRKYCSPRCRQAAYAKRQKAILALRSFMWTLFEFERVQYVLEKAADRLTAQSIVDVIQRVPALPKRQDLLNSLAMGVALAANDWMKAQQYLKEFGG